jgi:hypothetical protein
MDKQGNIAMGMSASSNTVKPSVWYRGAGSPPILREKWKLPWSR